MAGYTRQDTQNNISNGSVIDADDLDAEFNAVEAGFNSSTGHSHDGTAGEGVPITKVGPGQDLIVSSTALTPKTTNTLDLGTNSIQFKDAWFDGTVDTDALTVSGSATVGETLSVTGAITAAGFTGDVTGDVTGNVIGNVIGNVTGTVSDISNHDTDDIAEGSNLYFTNQRVDDRVAALVVGGTNMDIIYDDEAGTLTFTARSDGGYDLSNNDTGDLTEGPNLYYTDARARAAMSVVDAGGDGSLSYDSSTGAVTYTGPSAEEVRAHFSNGTGVTYSNGQFSIGQPVDTSSNVTFGNVTVGGNLTVSGTTTYINTQTLNIGDNIITLNADEIGVPSADAGIEVERGTSGNKSLFWDESEDEWTVGTDRFKAGAFEGNLIGNATTATTLANSRTISLSGDISGSASFNGSSNITITATVADDSHNHTISNVDGLQTALNSTASYFNTISAGSGLTGGGSIGTNPTISHADTSSQGSVNNSGRTYIQDIYLDTYGHVTGLSSSQVPDEAIGVGQSWATVSRSASTSYRNTTGRPIQISASLTTYDSNDGENITTTYSRLEVSTNSASWVKVGESRGTTSDNSNPQDNTTVCVIIPPNHYYRYIGRVNNFAILS